MEEFTIVRRDAVVRWYTVVDEAGQKHRWKMIANNIGAVHFVDPELGQVSPQLWGPANVRGWLLRNGFTPFGSRSPTWATEITQRRQASKPAA